MTYRNFNASHGKSSRSNAIPEYNKTYIAKIKDNRDVEAMGRLRVWIPELSQLEDDPGGWFTVNYCSPFAGATPEAATNNTNTYKGTQKSYGWWFVPPDLNNLVLVTFASGSTGLGFWIGCIYQDQMNHMVPGIPETKAEYNKNISGPKNPRRPTYNPLAEGLAQQGLSGDSVRGTSKSGARRHGDHGHGKSDQNYTTHEYCPSRSNGILTPGGHQIVFDDGTDSGDSKFIRMRTTSGAQILISESDGLVYLINRDGSAWFELSPTGNIDAFSSQNISLRSLKNVNIVADQDVNIEAGRNLNYKSRSGSLKIDIAKDADVVVGGALKFLANGIHTKSSDVLSLQGTTTNITGDDGLLMKGGKVDLDGGSSFIASASIIKMNGPSAASASVPDSAVTISMYTKPDIKQDGTPSSNIDTIASRMPTHEPYPEHDKGVPPDGTQVETEEFVDSYWSVAPDQTIKHPDVHPTQAQPPVNSGDPRGIRNNNPLNIRIGNSWRGRRESNTDGSFEQFIDASWGLRAAGIILRNYQRKHGLKTLQQMISRWAPNNENDTNNYVNFVSKKTGFSPDRVISDNDLPKMMAAMISIENGHNPYSIPFIYDSIHMA